MKKQKLKFYIILFTICIFSVSLSSAKPPETAYDLIKESTLEAIKRKLSKQQYL